MIDKKQNLQFFMVASSSQKSQYKGRKKSAMKGNPLSGISQDIKKITDSLGVFGTSFRPIITSKDQNTLLSKNYVLNQFANKFQKPKEKFIIFYTGHGQENTGNWAIQTLQNPQADPIPIEFIINTWIEKRITQSQLIIVMDSCYSGAWCKRTQKQKKWQNEKISIYASCHEEQPSYDSKDGGMLLNVIFCDKTEIEKNYRKLQDYQKPLLYKKNKVMSMGLKDINQLRSICFFQASNQVDQQKVYKTLVYDDGQYKGQSINNIRQGKGNCHYANGDKYEGYWKNGKRQGKGVYYYADGSKYEGDWKNDKKQGKGNYYYASQDRYEGDWKDGKKQGKGDYYYADGSIYKGDWKNDKRQGKGNCHYTDGDSYEGDWKDGKKQGEGVYYYADGSKYEGNFKGDKNSGKGVYYFDSGDRYEGDFEEVNEDCYDADVDTSEEYFLGDKIQGKGDFYYADGLKI